MKRIGFILAILFCTVAIADTITINWGVDNQPYTTTTCEIGGDVVLPTTPTKRGHVFRGWTAEHFDRGTFADWDSVPTNTLMYVKDYHNNQTPLKGDYIIIEDASLYPGTVDDSFAYITGGDGNVRVFYHGEETYITIEYTKHYIWNNVVDFYNYYSISRPKNISGYPMRIDDTVYQNNSQLPRGLTQQTVYFTGSAIDTWKFVYDGVWNVDGKSGWKPVELISNE